ncbi:permease prefix domain 1-containing protein [Rhizohabitans arisaemae]|uniref:permease prefix domain 1-containing protein n=1 Tax=Rhizohabitans arisaemae TaxID=2720610 RepID=UPI0024B27F75|nr:permease prefix domain 1-containing protein [Rhizohabitans arisaemae]
MRLLERGGRWKTGETRGSHVTRYMFELNHALRGPARVKNDMLDELYDGLNDEVEAHRAAGLPHREAERLAVESCGSVREVAPDLQKELSFVDCRRTAWLLFFLVALHILIAEFAWQQDPVAAADGGNRLGAGYLVFAEIVDYFQFVVVVVALGAAVVFGKGGRYIRMTARISRFTGAFTLFALLLKSASAVMLVSLVPGMLQGLMSLPGLAQQLILWVIPTCYVMRLAWRCLTVRMFPVTAAPVLCTDS